MIITFHLYLSTYFFYSCSVLFFFNDTATTEIYTLSLHDALPISSRAGSARRARRRIALFLPAKGRRARQDRKSTRLNSSHLGISYAVFCLKKKKKKKKRKKQLKKTHI